MRTGDASQHRPELPGAYPRFKSGRFRRSIGSYSDEKIRGFAVRRSPLTLKSVFMSYSITWEPDGVLVEFSGALGARDLIHSTRQVHADSRFDEANYIINDLSAITGYQLSEDGLRELSAINYGAFASQPNCRIVYVTTDAALAHQLETILMAPEMISYEIVCRPTLSAARDWLESQPQLHIMSNVMGFRIR